MTRSTRSDDDRGLYSYCCGEAVYTAWLPVPKSDRVIPDVRCSGCLKSCSYGPVR